MACGRLISDQRLGFNRGYGTAGIGRHGELAVGLNAEFIGAASDAEEAVVRPEFAPGIAAYPVVDARVGVSAIADDGDGVVDFLGGVGRVEEDGEVTEGFKLVSGDERTSNRTTLKLSHHGKSAIDQTILIKLPDREARHR